MIRYVSPITMLENVLDRRLIYFLLNPTNDESDEASNTNDNTNTDGKVRAVR